MPQPRSRTEPAADCQVGSELTITSMNVHPKTIVSQRQSPTARARLGRPRKRHVGGDLEGVGGKPGYPLGTLRLYNLRVGAKGPGRSLTVRGPSGYEDVNSLGHPRNLAGVHHEPTDRTGNCA